MIKLSEGAGFQLIPEGKHVFKIEDAEYDKDFGKVELHLVTENGLKHTERFNLIDKMGEINQGALNAFSYTAKVAMDDFSIQEIDHRDLIGKFIEAEVTHNKVPSNKEAGKYITFVNLGNKYASEGWEESSDSDMTLEDLLDEDEMPF